MAFTFALIVLDIAGLVVVGVTRAPSPVHLQATHIADGTQLLTSSETSTGTLSLQSSVTELDVLNAWSGASIEIGLDDATCAALATHLAGSCDKGLSTNGPLQFTWSVGTALTGSASGLQASTLTEYPTSVGGRYDACIEGGQTPLTLMLDPAKAGTLSIGNGEQTYFTRRVGGAPTKMIQVVSKGIGVPGCGPGESPVIIVQGVGYPTAVVATGDNISLKGATGTIEASTQDYTLTSDTTLGLEFTRTTSFELSFRPEDPPLQVVPDPAQISDIKIDGLEKTPTFGSAYPFANDVLVAVLAVLIAVFGVQILPRPTS